MAILFIYRFFTANIITVTDVLTKFHIFGLLFPMLFSLTCSITAVFTNAFLFLYSFI